MEGAIQRLDDWPYRIVKSDSDIAELGLWLQKMGAQIEKTPVGLSVSAADMAFATSEQGWIVPFATFSQIAGSVLRKYLFSERNSPAYCVRNCAVTVAYLDDWFGIGASDVTNNVIHDMTALERTTGRPIAQGLTTLRDALDCAVVAPMMAIEASSYYREVGLPLAKRRAVSVEGEDSNWSLRYDWLLFKVVGHYTRDPTLNKWFNGGSNPLAAFATACGGLTAEEASAFFLWMVCGEDDFTLAELHPVWATRMPESPQLVKAAYIDKNLPTLRLALNRMSQAYASSRRAITMYGRHSPWGLTTQALLHFAIMGSVEDIINVVDASLHKMGSEQHHVVRGEHDDWNRVFIKGQTTGQDLDTFEREVEELAKLGTPLGAIELEPKVSIL